MNAFRDDFLSANSGGAFDLQRIALQHWPGEVFGFDALLRLRWGNDRALTLLANEGQDHPIGIGWEELRLPWSLLPEDFDGPLGGLATRLTAEELARRTSQAVAIDLLFTPLVIGEEVHGVLLTSESAMRVEPAAGSVPRKAMDAEMTASAASTSLAASPGSDIHTALADALVGQWQRQLQGGRASIDRAWCEGLHLNPCDGEDHHARWEQQIHPDDLDEYRRRWQQVIAGESAAFEAEYRMLTLEHEWLWILQRGRVTQHDAAGRPLFATGICLEIDRRKREETSSRSNESRLATALWGAQAAFWQWHIPTNHRTQSALWNAMTGYRREQWEAESDPWRARIHPEDMRRVQERIDAYLQNGADSLEYEYRLRLANGQYKWLLDRARAVEWDLEGRPAVIMGVALDIDAQKRAEMELRASENRLQTAVWGANMGLWELDFVVEQTRWVNDWCRQYGIDPCDGGDHVNRWDSHIHEADVTEAARRFAEHVAGKEDYYDAEYRIRTAAGTWRWIYERGRVTERALDGKAQRMVGVCMDIDARRQEELRQHFTQPWLEQALTMARGGMWHWDIPSNTLTCTNTYYRLLGATPVEAHSDLQFWNKYVHPDDIERVEQTTQDLVSGARTDFDVEYRMRSGDGQWLWVHNCAQVVTCDNDGNAQSVVGFVTDVTARHESTEALRVSEMRFRFATAAVRGMIYEVDYQTDQALRFGTEELLGRPALEIGPTREHWLALMHPDDVAQFRRRRPRGHDIGFSDELEYRMLHADGHYIHVRDYAVTMQVREGGLPRRIGFIQNISNEHRNYERLRAQSHVLERLREGILMLDADWRVRSMNPAMRRLLGVDAAAAKGRLLPDLLGADAAHWLPICAEMDADPRSERDHSFTVTCHPTPDENLPCSLLLRRLRVGEEISHVALFQPLVATLPTLMAHEPPVALPVVGAGGPAGPDRPGGSADHGDGESGEVSAVH